MCCFIILSSSFVALLLLYWLMERNKSSQEEITITVIGGNEKVKAALDKIEGYQFSHVANSDIDSPRYVLNFGTELQLPALLEILNISYIGSGTACLIVCNQKSLVTSLANQVGVPVLIEEALPSKEYTVIIVGNRGDYQFFPILADDNKTQILSRYSMQLFEGLHCKDYARFDFRESTEGDIYFTNVDVKPDWLLTASPQVLEAILGAARKRWHIPA